MAREIDQVAARSGQGDGAPLPSAGAAPNASSLDARQRYLTEALGLRKITPLYFNGNFLLPRRLRARGK